MSESLVYLDSSAIVKLLLAEAGSLELQMYLAGIRSQTTSIVAAVEVARAIGRVDPASATRVPEVLGSMDVIALDTEIARQAARIGPSALRSLDAIHLASAIELGADLQAFVTYDRRLADAALTAGLPVLSPGLDL